MRHGKRPPRPGSNPIITATLFVVLSLCNASYAQSTASIEGQVIDQNGAAVAGVEITAMGSGIGVRRKANTDDSGRYQIASLPVADYRIDARARGFQTQTVETVRLR